MLDCVTAVMHDCMTTVNLKKILDYAIAVNEINACLCDCCKQNKCLSVWLLFMHECVATVDKINVWLCAKNKQI